MTPWVETAGLWTLVVVPVVVLFRPLRARRPARDKPRRTHTLSHVARVPPPWTPRPDDRPVRSDESVIAGGTEWDLALARHEERQRQARKWRPGA